VVLLLVGLGGAVMASMLSPRAGAVVVVPTSSERGSPTTRGSSALTLVVHVLGAVVTPGLYRLPEGSRVVDAVAAAGGFAADADHDGLNLARRVVDAEQIAVPVIGAAPAVAGPAAPGADGLVNLNTADRALLETLPRIGPATADRIIAWREANGGFASVEDLGEISGIGERTLDALRDLVSV
jgi:competence protein ComEA